MTDFNEAIPGLMDMSSPLSDALPRLVYASRHCGADTDWMGVPGIGPIYTDPDSLPEPAESCNLEFSRSRDFEDIELVLKSADEQVDITDAADWTFNVPPQPLPLTREGLWYWRAVVSAAGKQAVVTYGSVWIQP